MQEGSGEDAQKGRVGGWFVPRREQARETVHDAPCYARLRNRDRRDCGRASEGIGAWTRGVCFRHDGARAVCGSGDVAPAARVSSGATRAAGEGPVIGARIAGRGIVGGGRIVESLFGAAGV